MAKRTKVVDNSQGDGDTIFHNEAFAVPHAPLSPLIGSPTRRKKVVKSHAIKHSTRLLEDQDSGDEADIEADERVPNGEIGLEETPPGIPTTQNIAIKKDGSPPVARNLSRQLDSPAPVQPPVNRLQSPVKPNPNYFPKQPEADQQFDSYPSSGEEETGSGSPPLFYTCISHPVRIAPNLLCSEELEDEEEGGEQIPNSEEARPPSRRPSASQTSSQGLSALAESTIERPKFRNPEHHFQVVSLLFYHRKRTYNKVLNEKRRQLQHQELEEESSQQNAEKLESTNDQLGDSAHSNGNDHHHHHHHRIAESKQDTPVRAQPKSNDNFRSPNGPSPSQQQAPPTPASQETGFFSQSGPSPQHSVAQVPITTAATTSKKTKSLHTKPPFLKSTSLAEINLRNNTPAPLKRNKSETCLLDLSKIPLSELPEFARSTSNQSTNNVPRTHLTTVVKQHQQTMNTISPTRTQLARKLFPAKEFNGLMLTPAEQQIKCERHHLADRSDSTMTQAVIQPYNEDVLTVLLQQAHQDAERTILIQDSGISGMTRAFLVDWMFGVQLDLDLHSATIFIAVKIVDRVLELMRIPPSNLQLVGAVAILLASKAEGEKPPMRCCAKHSRNRSVTVAEMIIHSNGQYDRQVVLQAVKQIWSLIDHKVHAPHALEFLDYFCAVRGVNQVTYLLAKFALELSLHEPSFCAMLPYIAAAGALDYACRALERDAWDATMTTIAPVTTAQAIECGYVLNSLVGHPNDWFLACRLKYSLSPYHHLSLVDIHNAYN